MTAPTAAAAELAEVLEEVRRVEILGRRVVTDAMAGGWGSAFRGSGLEFEDVREYAEGDDVRAVDWNVTARAGRPFVRRYVEERERTGLVLVDLSASMAGGFGPWSGRQVAARVCACLALSAARNHDRAGFVGFGRRVESFLPPRRGRGHVLRIVRDCLTLPAEAGRTDLVPALELATRAVRRHAILFVLSDFLADGWRDALARCARRHDVVAVRLLPPELSLPARGILRAREPESGRELLVDAGDPRVRAAWDGAVAGWRARTEDALRQAGVDRMDVPVPRTRDKDAITGPILRFLRMREARSARP